MKLNKSEQISIPEAWFDNQPQKRKLVAIKSIENVANRLYKAELEARELIKLLYSDDKGLGHISLKGFLTMPPIDGATVLSLMSLMDEETTSRARELLKQSISKYQSERARKDRKKKPSKNELLAFIDKWMADKGIMRGAKKAAERAFDISAPTIRKILNQEN